MAGSEGKISLSEGESTPRADAPQEEEEKCEESRIFDSQVLKRQVKMEEKQQRRRHLVRHLRRVRWHPKSFGYLKGFEKS